MIEFGEIEKKYIRISIKVNENLKYVIFFLKFLMCIFIEYYVCDIKNYINILNL